MYTIPYMLFVENAPLSDHSTMKLGGVASYMCSVTSEDEIREALEFAKHKQIPYRMIGSGSNIVWKDEGFEGLIIVNDIQLFEINNCVVRIGAGMVWDDAVHRSVASGLSGIECLSLIPGATGATPIQNVGAYGAEIKDVLVNLRAYDTDSGEFVTLTNEQCEFGYRTSRFKTTDSGRFLISEITLKLSEKSPEPPFYESLQKYLDENNQKSITPQVIRDAVIAIRSSKLPDPAKIANNGSFFANPIVTTDKFLELQSEFPEIVGWDFDGGKKLAAGWLIEKAGFKDFHDKKTGMATWGNQSLVIVNETAESTSDLLEFRDKIIDAVNSKYSINLEQEPELL